MPNCKHTRLMNGMISGRLPNDIDKYYCTQCKNFVKFENIKYMIEKAKKKRNEHLAVRE